MLSSLKNLFLLALGLTFSVGALFVAFSFFTLVAVTVAFVAVFMHLRGPRLQSPPDNMDNYREVNRVIESEYRVIGEREIEENPLSSSTKRE